MIPAFKPLFFNLRSTSREKLVNEGGFFGQVLLLIRERHACAVQCMPAETDLTLTIEFSVEIDAMPSHDLGASCHETSRPTPVQKKCALP